MKHSTGPMNAEEARYVEACKSGFQCVACWLWEQSGRAPAMFTGLCGPIEQHHLVSGGRRVGHLWSVALGQWHHRRIVLDGLSFELMRRNFGPSLLDGSRTFHAAYGSDADLLAAQDQLLRERGIEPPARPENRRWAA